MNDRSRDIQGQGRDHSGDSAASALSRRSDASTQSISARTDEDRALVFPCERCGADLTFNIGAQSLSCPYCGYVKPLDLDPAASIEEQDFRSMLARIAERRQKGCDDEVGVSEVRCTSCGATVCFVGTLTSMECAYCGAPLQREDIQDAERRVPVDGVLPFLISREVARENLRKWVSSRWFAPNDFKARGVQGRFNGIYLPYWTFDSATTTHYTGQRGEHYYVTVGSGKNRRTVRRTRWYPASGTFQRFFDDVLVVASTGLPTKRIVALEPWPLNQCIPFDREVLAGFLARTYDIVLDEGFVGAKQRMDDALNSEVRQRIGGDTQRVHSVNTRYDAITFKHLLLPVWMLAYRYGKKSYQVVVNAGTGEVQGDRPYSWIKIALAVAAALIVCGMAAYFYSQG
ncbi:MAG: hypothetical protein IH988_07970 [Planctomycetes bacterium]|nr:hypothetical protein [Planctomycetota bacterium]